MLFTLNGWIFFSRLSVVKEFATYFLSLHLYSVNILIWKKIISFTFFKIITVSSSSTLLRVFLMGISGSPTKGGNLGGPPASQKVWTSPICWISPPSKNLLPCPLITLHILGKKGTLTTFIQILWKILPETCIFSNTLMTYWKKFIGTKSLDAKSVLHHYLPELFPIIPLNI